MPFGKHAGKPMRDVPDDYLEWLSRQELERWKGLREFLHSRAKAEVAQ
jgi:uncharacterized protein (DUF3820 family)